MKSFFRIFKYVWPQWPRIIVVVLTAIIVSTLLSLSFVTVLPLLKVMTGEEGLHNWVDRKVSSHRYGMEIYLPEKVDFSKSDIAYYLQITSVREESLARDCGLRKLDQIIDAGDFIADEEPDKIPAGKLLEVLAKAPANAQVTIRLRRFNEEGFPEIFNIQLKTGNKGFGLRYIEKAMAFLPRTDDKAGKMQSIVFIILAMAIATIIRCLAKFYQSYLAQKVVHISINRLREDAYMHVMNMPMSFFANERPSDTVSRVLGDTAAMGTGIKVLLGKALREPLNVIFLVGCAMWINSNLTLIFLGGAPFALLLVAGFGKQMKKATKKSLMIGSQMLGKLQETMQGLMVVKIYNRQKHEHKHFEILNKKLLKQLLEISKVDAATTPVLEVFGMAALSAALLAGASWMQSGEMEGSEFIMLLMLLGSAAEAVRKTSGIWNKVQSANAAAERVYAVIDEPAEFEKPGAIEVSPLKNKIEFRNVVFTYPGSSKPALNRINLTIKAGQTIAVVGPNGSGKTTLVNLIPRFYDVDSGAVLIDGQDVRECTFNSLRNQIAMVTQNVVTFNDTIAVNIGYGKSDATMEEIISAAKRSFVHEFIEPLPEGYDALIGEQGCGFSGGQLQRIVIARAILKNPAILIFDEAMSQVDADSEAKIHEALSDLMHERTCFVIAHRFSTVVSADTIVVMDEGQIVAQGKHNELIRDCKLYRSLYETQLITPE